ncbi:MAG TPA: hypothetical protein VJZ71_09325 [Phycisphaerae bacterium]|nr:hypothetical protein [Phycisphaerae bacterium]
MRQGKYLQRLRLVVLLTAAGTQGCSMAEPDRAERMTRGYLYYCDGAGGGGLVSNWAGGVRSGLAEAGYNGAGEIFRWNTGFGVYADQVSSVEYKQQKAKELANEIVAYQAKYPGAAVHLMGLSAGTAVVAYALEALPPQASVDNVVMLSGSLSSTHNLTNALRRVKGKMYIFTSQRDEVLLALVPFAGTADRTSADSGTIGLNGARLPRTATSEAREQYRKIVTIPWNPQFERYGNRGGHTDTVAAPFVQQFVAPLVVTGTSRSSTAVASAGTGHVENPDYARWSRFAAGSWVVFEGDQIEGGTRQPIRVRVTLVEKEPDRLLIQREAEGSGEIAEALTKSFYVTRHIDPAQHPFTQRGARRKALPSEAVTIGSRRIIACKAQSVEIEGDFPVWGHNVKAMVVSSPEIPGGIARIELDTELNGQPIKVAGRAVDYNIGSSIQ